MEAYTQQLVNCTPASEQDIERSKHLVCECGNSFLSAQEDIVVLPRCRHLVHAKCLEQRRKGNSYVTCFECSTVYGKIIGVMPSGQMKVEVTEDGESIQIEYHLNFEAGPWSINTFLPNTAAGNQVLEGLAEAFERKLTFVCIDGRWDWQVHHSGQPFTEESLPGYLSSAKKQLERLGIYLPES